MGAGMTMAKHRLMLNEPHLVSAQSDGILTMETDMRAPLKALRVGFEPVQEGEGDPSPENVRPITGWGGVEISHTPRNILPKHLPSNAIKGTIGTGSTHISDATNARCFAFYIGKNKRIRYRRYEEKAVAVVLAFCDSDALNLTMPIYSALNMTNRSNTALNSGDHPYLIVCPSSVNVYENEIDNQKISVFFDDEDVGYSPRADWSPVPISWTSEAGTIYGGYLEWLRDGTVRVTKTHESVALSSLTWKRRTTNPYRFSASLPSGKLYTNAVDVSQHKCSIFPTAYTTSMNNTKEGYLGVYRLPTQTGADETIYLRFADTVTTLTELNAFLAEANPQYCYPLADPVTYTLTPAEALRTLRGENNLWSDANGGISATYWKH